jgi:hypothetical protein
MFRLWHKAKAQVRRLLRVLFLRLGALSANSANTLRRTGCSLLLCVTGDGQHAPTQAARDWLGSLHSSLLAWWMPKAAILAGLFVPVSVRAVIDLDHRPHLDGHSVQPR